MPFPIFVSRPDSYKHMWVTAVSPSVRKYLLLRERGGGDGKKGDTGLMRTKESSSARRGLFSAAEYILLNKDGAATKSARNASHPLFPEARGGRERERRIRSHRISEEGDSFIGHVGTL